jgi:hypothetical protein
MVKKCPYCGSEEIDAEFVDIGVGMCQVSPYHCLNCDATEIGKYDEISVTDEEKKIGWYKPLTEVN